MRKLLLIITLAIMGLLAANLANAQTTIVSGTCGENLTWVLTSDNVLTISGTGAMINYSDDNSPWYSNRTKMKTVVINDGVTSIGNNAFGYCGELTSIVIPNSVTNIGDNAFKSCRKLTSATIPNSVTSIGNEVFGWCSGLTSVTIGNSVTSIGEYAFRYCSGLTSVTIPNSVTSIREGVFFSCSGLTSVTIGNSVTSIGVWAFIGCSGLTSLTIPNSVTSIENAAFSNCGTLDTVYFNADSCRYVGDYYSYDNWLVWDIVKVFIIGENVRYIPNYLCQNQTALKSITIPNSVTSIGSGAFLGCNGLTLVTIGNSVTSIGNSAFGDCSGLTSVTIPNSVTNIGSSAFDSDTVYFNADSCGYVGNENYWHSEYEYGSNWLNADTVKVFVIGENVRYIPNYLCHNQTALKSITIPSNVMSIGDNAFSGCSGLLDCYVSWEVPPSIYYNVFENIYTINVKLHVPLGTFENYREATNWRNFTIVEGIVVETVVTPTKTSVAIEWEPVADAYEYVLAIYKNDIEVANVSFDKSGNIMKKTADKSGSFFIYNLDGLSEGTTYSYILTAYDKQSVVLAKKYSAFTTLDKSVSSEVGVCLQVSGSALRVYPNPTSGVVYVDGVVAVAGLLSLPEVSVYNLGGRLVGRFSGSSIDLSKQSAGVYILRAGNKTARVVKK